MSVFDKLRKGAEASAKAAAAASAGGGGRFTRQLRWGNKKGQSMQHYVLFLSDWESIPTVLMHKMLDCGQNEEGNTIWRSFISQADPAIGGDDPLITKHGLKPRNQNIAFVVLMEPVTETKGGRQVVKSFVPQMDTWTDKDGEEHTEPAVRVIVESPSTFFSYFATYAEDEGPIENVVFSVTRVGTDTNTTYNPIPSTKPFELGDDFDLEASLAKLEAYVNDLADDERMHTLIDHLDEGHVFDKYAEMRKKEKEGKGDKKSSSSKSSAKKSTPKSRDTDDEEPAAEEELPADDSGDGDGEEEVAAAAPKASSGSGQSRFQKLRAQVNG